MISVIIVNYNTLDLVRACIRSLQDKSAERLEIIVVDNASTEGNVEDLQVDFPQVRLIRNSENVGFARANNMGVRAAESEYILLLNSDTELINDAPGICRAVLEKDPTIGVVSAQLQFPDGRLQHCCQAFPSLSNDLLEITRLHKLMSARSRARRFLGSYFDHRESASSQWVWGTFFMFRKADLQRLVNAKLSERFFMYGEDLEWCYQFRLAGLTCYYEASAKVIHLMGGSEYGDDDKKYATIVKHELQFVKSYLGAAYYGLFRRLRAFKYLLAGSSPRYKSMYRAYVHTEV